MPRVLDEIHVEGRHLEVDMRLALDLDPAPELTLAEEALRAPELTRVKEQIVEIVTTVARRLTLVIEMWEFSVGD